MTTVGALEFPFLFFYFHFSLYIMSQVLVSRYDIIPYNLTYIHFVNLVFKQKEKRRRKRIDCFSALALRHY